MIDLDNKTITIKEIELIARDERFKKKYEKKFENKLYSLILLSLTHESFSEENAKLLWEKIVLHMRELDKTLGRSVGISVASLDFLSNFSDSLMEPKIIEENKSDFVTEVSTSDELTGLYLRDVFNIVLKKESEKAKRKNTSLCLLMIDIDDFKMVNDRFGHQEGDNVLNQIGAIIKGSVRDMDLAARYGGEEIVIIMPETNIEDAYEVAQRIRKNIMQKQFAGFSVTVSIGLTCSGQNPVSPEQMIKAADNGLYKAKKNGKNQVIISKL